MKSNIETDLEKAGKGPPDKSPFDYIIVGSGAGGGPLAARLALGGKRVLLLEAGRDPAKGESIEFPDADPGEIYRCPGYHAAATEDSEMSWSFSVRHYEDEKSQKNDDKYLKKGREIANPSNPDLPPVRYPNDDRFFDQVKSGGRKGGILYPRAAALGGCTAHHAMILIAPNDKDWDEIADLTGDRSWGAETMSGYFAKMERCLYRGKYQRWFQSLLGPIFRIWRGIVRLIYPKAVLDDGGHGRQGWQATSFIEPALIEEIKKQDVTFTKVLLRTLRQQIRGRFGFFKWAALKLQVDEYLDPNDLNTRRDHPEGAFLIPTGIESGDPADPAARDENGVPLVGQRTGIREFLEKTRKQHPDLLVIQQGVHVTRVLFDWNDEYDPGLGEVPRVPKAIGVEYVEGDHLYEASPLFEKGEGDKGKRRRFFCSSEVILCGGAFNTPQLLMLSGIGEAAQFEKINEEAARASDAPALLGISGKDGKPLAEKSKNGKADSREEPLFVNLPGVGKNLQDRYEVSVVSEVADDFPTLKTLSFTPGDPEDAAGGNWRNEKTGLYGTNGGTIAVIQRSKAAAESDSPPDLFSFGAPAAFRGYYWGWSRELLKPTLGAPNIQRNLWSWVILKAYTSNDGGTVKLLNADPFAQPEICFDSFNEAAKKRKTNGEPKHPRDQAAIDHSVDDVDAIVEAISLMRDINAAQPDTFVREIQPGKNCNDLEDWIRSQAWGHHASCTCRIGADRWKADPAERRDKQGVLDSKFQVQGVKGLRVVDASVFPKIPGYFIAVPIFMVAEKAADTILSDSSSSVFPAKVQQTEAEAIRERRKVARVSAEKSEKDREPTGKIPENSVGVALSGGGIRSATFALGVLQALAGKNRIREVDYVSSVSGGGFTASFLGRLFTRKSVTAVPPGEKEDQYVDPAGQVQDVLKNSSSGPLWWLRTQANYILNAGLADVMQNLAVFWRNLFAVHLVLGVLLFALFGTLALVSGKLPAFPLPEALSRPWLELSAWWIVPGGVLAFLLLPFTLGYWLAPKSNSYRPYPVYSLIAWLVALGIAAVALMLPIVRWASAAILILLLAWVYQEMARWDRSKKRDSSSDKLPVSGSQGGIVRNRLTRALATSLKIFILGLAWFLLDTAARSIASHGPVEVFVGIMLALAPLLPALRWVGMGAMKKLDQPGGTGFSLMTLAKIFALPLGIFLLLVVDVLAHKLTDFPFWWAVGAIVSAAVFSYVIGKALDFLNRSSLHTQYAARLTRTFQGASNEARVYGSASNPDGNVQFAHPGDDLPFHEYHPERTGGPIHLINLCINDTVDFASGREIRERKGLSMCVNPLGVSVGTKYFAEWTKPDKFPRWQRWRRRIEGLDSRDKENPLDRDLTALRAIPLPGDPDGFHVLASRSSDSAEVEPLSLGAWTAISGAAYTTGSGRNTGLLLSLFLGILNLRLGHWWDTGIRASERPNRYPENLWRRIKKLPSVLFRTQSLLLSEWKGRFPGAARWFWYLSDGGHFEVTGLYELLRRQLPFMILVDAGEDPNYQWSDLARLERQARIDFGAQFTWAVRDDETKNKKPWDRIEIPNESGEEVSGPPEWIQQWIEAENIGAIDSIHKDPKKDGKHAALARVTYSHSPGKVSWVLVLKPSFSSGISQDIRTYAAENTMFPQDPTFDQVFKDDQWESYRALGQEIGNKVIKKAGTEDRP